MTRPTFASLVVYLSEASEAVWRELDALAGWADSRFEAAELVLVDDAAILPTIQVEDFRLARLPVATTVVTLAWPHGVEEAMLAGLEYAHGDFVIELDVLDVPERDALLDRLLDRCMRGTDIVTAGERVESVGRRLFYGLVNRFSRLRVELMSERVRVSSRRAVAGVLGLRERVRYRRVLFALTGYPRHHETYEGRTRPPRQGQSLPMTAIDLLLSTTDVGMRVAHLLSLIFGLASVGGGLWALLNWFLRGDVIEGWTTVMLLLSIGFTGIFAVLGVLGEYLVRTLIEVRGRPTHTVAGTVTYVPDHAKSVIPPRR